MLERRGFTTQVLTVEGAPPAVYGSLTVPNATRTVVFYAHFDGQPVVASEWVTPAWSPVLREGTLEAGAAVVPWTSLPSRIPGLPKKLPQRPTIPPAYRPPSGMCRIWIEGVPPNQQPAPTDCVTAVRNRPVNGHVIFGDDSKNRGREKSKKGKSRKDLMDSEASPVP